MGEGEAQGEAHMTFPPMPGWFPDFCRELFALTSAEKAELLATLPVEDTSEDRSSLPTPAKRQRKPSLGKLIAQAEKSGKPVSSITTPDGVTLQFGEPEPTEATNPWLADLKATKQ